MTEPILPRLYDGQIRPDAFDHSAHLQAGWECIQKENPEGPRKLASSLYALADSAGAPERYHATITGAFLTLIAASARPGESFDDFLAKNPDLSRRDCLERYYSRARLTLPEARRRFLMPDRRPLPACRMSLCSVEIPAAAAADNVTN
ncbi:MAG: hypothetical protein AAF358_19345 [Pseudomonadota bacterium]